MASAPDTPFIRFRTLGATDLRLSTGEELRGVLTQPKRLALLAYLAIEKPDGFHRRDTLLALFWPELDVAHARDALNQAIRHLRLELGADVIVSRGTTEVGLDGNRLWCDVVAFRQAIAAQDAEQALDLYQGDLLEGFFATGAAAEFDQWVEAQRSDVRRRASSAAVELTEWAATRQDVARATAWARRVVELKPESEDELRRVLGVLDRIGERTTAIGLYHEFAQRLAREFGAEPTPETRYFMEGIRARQDLRSMAPNGNGTAGVTAPGALPSIPPTRDDAHADSSAQAPEGRLTWRKAVVLGALSFVGLAAITGSFVAMRASCIGPAKTLLACGTLSPGASLVLADFVDHTPEATLAPTVTEALRVDLSASNVIRLMQASTVRQTMGRMQRDPNEKLTPEIAREIALREGSGAVILGETSAAGSGFVLMAQLVAAESGDVLLGVRAEAADSSQIIRAIERLSTKLRAGIGESLVAIRSLPPLERAVTSSLPALQRFTAGNRAFSRGDYEAAIRLLREATTFDTTFAEAYRTLGAQLNNVAGARREQIDALTHAFRFRERLPPRMRHFVAGSYYSTVGGDVRVAVREYQAAVDADPTFRQAIANQGGLYAMLREFEHYRANVDWMLRVDRPVRGYYYHLVMSLLHLGRLDSARQALAQLDSLVRVDPGYTRARDEAASLGAWLGFQQRDYVQVRRRAAALQESANPQAVYGEAYSAYADAIEGHVTKAEQRWRSAIEHARSRTLASVAIGMAAALSDYEVAVHGDSVARLYLRDIDARIPLDSIPDVERPYEELVIAHARAGDLASARLLMREMEAKSPSKLLTYDQRFLRIKARGILAMASGKLADAVQLLRAADSGSCVVCVLPDLAHAYDRSNNVDSAIVVYERYVNSFDDDHWQVDPVALAPALRRLGELFEKRGDNERAVYYYNQFLELWKHADAELQPQVRGARRHLTRITERTQLQ